MKIKQGLVQAWVLIRLRLHQWTRVQAQAHATTRRMPFVPHVIVFVVISIAFKSIPDRKQQLIDVSSLFDLPNRTDKNYMDYLATVSDDLDKRGMEYPILVVEKDNYWNRFPWQDDTKMGVVTGSNRFRYAMAKGYTHIEGIIINNKSDWFTLWEKTYYNIKWDLTNGQ